MVRWADGDVLTLLTLAKWLRRDTTRFVDRARCRLRRPLYYAQERARREALAAERRRVGGRRTTNPCPTRKEVLEAWIHRRESHEAAVRFGSLVHDLECYVDNSLLRDGDGAIVGRRGGVKAWLQVNIPALYVRYTTVMRYKAMAKRLRQVTGLADPVPAAAVLAPPAQGGTAAEGGTHTRGGDHAEGGPHAQGGYAEGGTKAGDGKRDYGAYEILCKGRRCPSDGGNVAEVRVDAPDLACRNGRRTWRCRIWLWCRNGRRTRRCRIWLWCRNGRRTRRCRIWPWCGRGPCGWRWWRACGGARPR